MKVIEEWMVAGAYNPGLSLFTGPMLVKDGEWLMGMQNCQSAVHLWTVLSYAVITGREKLFPDFTSGYQYMRISFMNHAVLWRMTRRCPTTQLISRDWILTGSQVPQWRVQCHITDPHFIAYSSHLNVWLLHVKGPHSPSQETASWLDWLLELRLILYLYFLVDSRRKKMGV